MKTIINQMNTTEAVQISNWTYEYPYSIYSMDGSEECIRELLNGFYFSVKDENNNLIGYYCFGEAAQVPIGKKYGAYDDKNVIDIGLGIRPDLCGSGLGIKFLMEGLEFAKNQLSSKDFRLTVAIFNKRAIKVYENAGFIKIGSFTRVLETSETEFWVMSKKLSV